MIHLNLFLKRKKQESRQPRKTPIRLSSCEAVLLSQTTSLQNRTQSIKDMNFADAYNCLQNRSLPYKFVSRLKALAATCNFTEIDTEVKSKVISGCISQRLRQKGLIEVTWDLSKLIEVGKVYELSDNTSLPLRKSMN